MTLQCTSLLSILQLRVGGNGVLSGGLLHYFGCLGNFTCGLLCILSLLACQPCRDIDHWLLLLRLGQLLRLVYLISLLIDRAIVFLISDLWNLDGSSSQSNLARNVYLTLKAKFFLSRSLGTSLLLAKLLLTVSRIPNVVRDVAQVTCFTMSGFTQFLRYTSSPGMNLHCTLLAIGLDTSLLQIRCVRELLVDGLLNLLCVNILAI